MQRLHAEALLRENDGLRELAGELVRDPNEADDLRQATLLEALQRPPVDPTRSRGWLRTVLVNRLRQDRRARSRRAARERRVAHRDESPDTADIAARAQLFRGLAEAVCELDEPFRTAIVLRFYDGLPPRVIAERTGVPVATVRSRVRRGLERLRRELDASHGGRSAWALLLLPTGLEPPRTALATILMQAKTPIALVTVALVTVTAGLVGLRAELVPDVPGSRPADAAEPLERAGTAAAPEPAASARTALEHASPPVSRPAGAPSEPRDPLAFVVARGRVLDLDGRGRAGLRVVLQGDADAEPRGATTGAGGRFALEVPAEDGRFVLADGAWTTVSAGVFAPHPGAPEPVVVAAPAATFAGRALDDGGRPLEGARVTLAAPADLGYRIDSVLDGSDPARVATSTGIDGRFELAGWIAERSWIGARDDDHVATEVRAPSRTTLDLEIRLAPRRAPRELLGEVVDPSGRPVPQAWVSVGVRTTRADERGRFRFWWNPPMDRIVAVAAGYRPGTFELDSAAVPADADPPFVRVALPGPTRTLSGRVVDEDGRARAGVQVWIADPTYFGETREDASVVEGLAAGLPTAGEIEARLAEEHADEIERGDREAFDEALVSTPSAFWPWTSTPPASRSRARGSTRSTRRASSSWTPTTGGCR